MPRDKKRGEPLGSPLFDLILYSIFSIHYLYNLIGGKIVMQLQSCEMIQKLPSRVLTRECSGLFEDVGGETVHHKHVGLHTILGVNGFRDNERGTGD
jgi:hypothetical protein